MQSAKLKMQNYGRGESCGRFLTSPSLRDTSPFRRGQEGSYVFKIYFAGEFSCFVSQPLLKGEVAKSLAILTERYASLV